LELLTFAKEAKFPVLIKPRLLAASVGIEILRNEDEVFSFARQGFGASVEAQRLLIAESFVDFENEYHVDGIVVDGTLRFIWPSRYVGYTSGFGTAELFGAVMLDDENPKRAALCDLIEATINALPALENSTFHAEVFETRDGRLLVNEIAGRTGGFRINDHIKAGFGLWLNREWARLQAGLGHEIADELNRDRKPDQLAGYALFRPTAGRIVSIPEHCPFDFIYDYRTDALVGQSFEIGESSTHQMGSTVVIGKSEAEVEARLLQVHSWFYSTLKMEKA
jgi:biotin carboxylase